MRDFLHRKGGGRFVEHDQIGVVMHRTADRDALALAAGKLGDGGVDGDPNTAKAYRLQKNLLGDSLLLLDVDEAEAVGDLPADEKVPPERLLISQ